MQTKFSFRVYFFFYQPRLVNNGSPQKQSRQQDDEPVKQLINILNQSVDQMINQPTNAFLGHLPLLSWIS